MLNKNRTYSLRKSKKVFLHIYHLMGKQKKRLPEKTYQDLEAKLANLEETLMQKDREKANALAKDLENAAKVHLRKTSFEQLRDLVFALGFALIIAVIVRTMWFEFYEIPSGSMRPTFKEQDRVAVSKTNFGINIPLSTGHFYYEPDLVKRSGIFIFTGANMDIRDVNTLYFYLFPGKKQYIKRLMGKPDDTVYFYGGLMYGIDATGKDITPELQYPQLGKIDHIPFINFEGKTITPRTHLQGVYSPVIIHQMNEPVARLTITASNQARGELIANNDNTISDYSDLWGFKNFAMARLLTRGEVKAFTDSYMTTLSSAPSNTLLFLELKHHPSLSSVQVLRDEMGRVRPSLGYTSSIIPLNKEQLKTLFSNIYTARFFVKNERAYRFGASENSEKNPFLPRFPGVPDGCYEYYHGKAYQVKWQGLTSELPPSHPLSQFSPELVQELFNIGIEFDMHFMPQYKNQRLYPSRYAYYRDGDLYVLGAPLLKKTDPTLIAFVNEEAKKEVPFIDNGPPLKKDGQLDVDFIKRYGLKIPPKSYLGLGDNHAMSADSRDFGFIPEDNVRGAPDFIFWPPGNRFGHPNQPSYPLFTMPRVIIWILAAIVLSIWWTIHKRRTTLPLIRKKNK